MAVKKKKSSAKTKSNGFPKITLDQSNQFASIKLASGVEAKSYEKSGFIFSEDSKGRVISIQILNYKT